MGARRYNNGKMRYDLLPSRALEDIVKVFSLGAHKYTIYEDQDGNEVRGADVAFEKVGPLGLKVTDAGDDNWRKGLPWKAAMASVERHIASWKMGDDMDELGTYHLGNAIWGLMVLLEQYRTHPELDNRYHPYLTEKRIGLDVDEVICGFVKGFTEYFGLSVPANWYFSYNMGDRFEELSSNEDFWLSLPVKTKPQDIPFEPACYITSRPVLTSITQKWLEMNGFSTRPVYTVGLGKTKVEAAKEAGLDWFIDDAYHNFLELNKAGICTFLLSAPHNERYDVGYKRIDEVKDILR